MTAPHSRLRGLIRDLTDGLAQQMYLWGRDVRHPDGNALVRAGLQRIARIDNDGEGTSLYRIERDGGWIELHGFCAGWRPHDSNKDGMLYIRRCQRIFIASGQMTPGRYDMSRLRSGSVEELGAVCNPFLRWWVEYEQWAAQELGAAWRTECWRDYLKLRRARPWLTPVQAVDWLLAFLGNPSTQKRPREILRASTSVR
ncbi:MAG: hypothetical protein ACKO39_13555 [Chthoniobacterales bacterium]